MSLEVRPCTADELAAGLSPIWHFFGSAPSEEALERMREVLEPGRLHAAWEDGQAVGGAAAYSFQLTVPGGRVPAAGVAAVGVFPTHRRRGVLRAMMRAQLDDVRERREPVAYLWSSEPMIYGRFGYGVASVAGEIHIPRTRAGFAEPFEPRGRVRLVSVEEALELMPPVYESVARETPGMFARSAAWWEHRVLADAEWRRRGGGEMARAVLEVGGRVEAYGLYRLHASFEAGSSTGFTSVIEAMAVSPEATREIWRYLFDVDWMESVKAYLLPPDHPLWLLLADPRRMLYRSGDGTWLRLVDVEAALAARSYEDGEPVVFEVRDAFCPWNEGRYRVGVGGGGAERTDAEPEIRLDVSALGSAYLGGFTFGQLARALRLEEARPGSAARADALFRTDRAPWCPEIF